MQNRKIMAGKTHFICLKTPFSHAKIALDTRKYNLYNMKVAL